MNRFFTGTLVLSGALLTATISISGQTDATAQAQNAQTPAITQNAQTETPAIPPKDGTKIVYVYTTQPPPSNNVAANSAAPAAPAEQDYSFGGNPLFCAGRGVINMGSCWLELPRCIIYDNKVIPIVGTFLGIPEGAGYTVVRALVGVADMISFGLDGGALYGKYLPSFIWEANWQPPKKQ